MKPVPADLAARIEIYIGEAPGDGGHCDVAGANCWELLREAKEELRALSPQAQAGGVAQAAQEPVAWRWRDKDPKFNQTWSYTEVDITERGNWVVEPLYAAPQPLDPAYEAKEPAPLEVWNGDRKVTVYEKEVFRIWGTDIEEEMSSEQRDHQTVAAAFDWLYADGPSVSSTEGK